MKSAIISWVSSIMRIEILRDFEIKKEILKQMSHVTRKPVFAICEQQRCRSAWQQHSLISAFVFPCLDSIVPRLATAEISRLYLVENPKTGFLMARLKYFSCHVVFSEWDASPCYMHGTHIQPVLVINMLILTFKQMDIFLGNFCISRKVTSAQTFLA